MFKKGILGRPRLGQPGFVYFVFWLSFDLGDLGVFIDLNELGSSSDFNNNRCAELKRDSKATDVGTVTVQMKNRHYIKAVGINTRNDDLSG